VATQEVEVFAAYEIRCQPVPFTAIQALGQDLWVLRLHRRAGDNGHLLMRLGDVKVVDGVTEGVGVGK